MDRRDSSMIFEGLGASDERHLLKRRPGRREAEFVGSTRLVGGRRIVEAGWIVKRVRPERAGTLVERYAALARSLPAGGDPTLPRVAPVLRHSIEEGWLLFAAFPGCSLAAWPSGPERTERLCATAAALAALERAETAARNWPRHAWTVADERVRLEALARSLGRPLPAFTAALCSGLERLDAAESHGPAHRDLNEEQIIAAAGDPAVCWIDWDEAALGPLGLDLGNLLAHERLRSLRTHEGRVDGSAIRHAYHAAGGRVPDDRIDRWEALACLRLSLLVLRTDGGERNPEWVPMPSMDPATAAGRSLALEAMAGRLAGG